MGCGSSAMRLASLFDVYARHPSLSALKPKFERLHLSSSAISALWDIYAHADADGSGEMSFEELLAHIDLDATPFSARVFALFDEDGSGQISFFEFVLTLWNYCTLSKATLTMFAFDLYDRDNSGCIDRAEMLTMLRDIYGSEHASSPHARAILSEIETKMTEDSVSLHVFSEFCRRKPALLFPAFQMQSMLQQHSLGTAYWERLSCMRMELCHGEYLSMGQFMALHVDARWRSQQIDRPLSEKRGMNADTLEIIAASGPMHKRGSEKRLEVAGSGKFDGSGTSGKHKFKAAAATLSAAKKFQEGSHKQSMPGRPCANKKAQSMKEPRRPPPVDRQGSTKSVKFNVNTTVHSPDRVETGMLKAAASRR